MRELRGLVVVVIAALLLSASPRPASAEWFADAFLGFSFTSNADVTFDTSPRTRTFKDVDFNRSVVLGARGGYWFTDMEALGGLAQYLGLGLEFSYSRPAISAQVRTTEGGARRIADLGIDLFTLTPLAMARYPLLPSDEYPRGRLQPYAIVGPAIFIANAQDSGTFGPRGRDASDAGVGFLIGPGIGWFLTPQVMLFTEYRFVHAGPTFDFSGGPVDVPINTHQITFGASYRF
jgi:opacity protein-like surface antigen